MLRVPMVRALSVVLLFSVLSTALFVHLVWFSAASHNVETAVERLNAGVSSTVNRELAEALSGAEGAAEIVRSALFQGTIDPNDEAKREFLFLSVLRSQPALTWIGFGFPDGRFFGAHASDTKIEMIEIGVADADQPRSLRQDVYKPIAGDIIFEERIKATSEYVSLGSLWYRSALTANGAVWTTAPLLPAGFEPAAVVSNRVDRYGEFTGVVMVAVGLDRLSYLLKNLDLAKEGAAVVMDADGQVLATSADVDGSRPARLSDFPESSRLAQVIRVGLASKLSGSFTEPVEDSEVGSVYVTASDLPFRDWQLITAIPRSFFAAQIDRANRFLPFLIGILSLLAASTSAILANILFARPLRRLSSELGKIGQFRLDDVRYKPTFLKELDEFSLGLRHMSVGLASFGLYLPLEVVRLLVARGDKPAPGGEIRTVTVMFADLPGFTEMSEKLGPGVEPYLTKFLTLAVEIITKEGGTVDKFIGDEVMAFWNAPNDVPDHSERACRAALAIRSALHEISLPLAGPGSYALGPRVRIGIHSGSAIIGNIGSERRLSYTAIGDTVNLASRLVGVAKEHASEIVISKATFTTAKRATRCRPLGVANIRGRSEPVEIYSLDEGSENHDWDMRAVLEKKPA